MSGIIKIALLCVLIGASSIPISFKINSSPAVVWLGNALGSAFSALVVIYIGDRLTSEKFKARASKRRIGKKVVTAFDQGEDNQKVQKARDFINKHGLRVFAFFCPIFPGVLISTTTVYLLDLDKQKYKRWMLAGVIFASGTYVLGYWWIFVKQH